MKIANRKFEGKEVASFEQVKVNNKWFDVWYFKMPRDSRRQDVCVRRYTMSNGVTEKFLSLKGNTLGITLAYQFQNVK